MALWRKEEKRVIPSFPNEPYWDLYSDWEREVDNIYHDQRISDEKLLRLVILKFEGNVLTWWNKMERIWRKERRPKIDTWQRMKYVLRERCEPFSREWQFYDAVVKKEKEREDTELRERKLREKRERKLRLEKENQERIERENQERKAREEWTKEFKALELRMDDLWLRIKRDEEAKKNELQKKKAKAKEKREKEAKEKELREKEIKERELLEKQEKEENDSLLAYTNPLIDCDVSYFKDDVEVATKDDSQVQVDNLLCEDVGKKEVNVLYDVACDPLYKNPFVLMPREELYIKEPWIKQCEEKDVPKELELPLEKISLPFTTLFVCNLNVLSFHTLECHGFDVCEAYRKHNFDHVIRKSLWIRESVHNLTIHYKLEMHSSNMVLVSVTFTFWNKSKNDHGATCLCLLVHASYSIKLCDGYIILVFDPGGRIVLALLLINSFGLGVDNKASNLRANCF